MFLDKGVKDDLTELEIQRKKTKQWAPGASRQIENTLGLGTGSGEISIVAVESVGLGAGEADGGQSRSPSSLRIPNQAVD